MKADAEYKLDLKSMRPKVEAELIRLEQLGIIEKVKTADFSTTPIVPMLRARAVASMGQGGGGIAPPPILGVAPPVGSCPGHSRKPAFGNGAIAS